MKMSRPGKASKTRRSARGEASRPREGDTRTRVAAQVEELEALGARVRRRTLPLGRAARSVTESVARNVRVQRVAISFLDESRTCMEVVDRYDCATRRHSSGLRVPVAGSAALLSRLARNEPLAFPDVKKVPFLRGLGESGVMPADVRAVLVVPVLAGGQMAGVLSLSHVGRPRQWTPMDRLMAIAGAQVVAAIHEGERRERAERAYRDSERIRKALDRTASDSIFIADRACRISYVNEHAARELRRPSSEIVGRTVFELFPPHISERQARNLRKVFDSGEAVHVEAVTEYPRGTAWLDTWLVPLAGADGRAEAVMGVSRDVTARHQLEEEQRRVENLRSLGYLAGGIAHDFNNILTAALGNLTLARAHPEDRTELLACLDGALEALASAKDLSKQLLVFSQGGAPRRKLASLADLVRASTQFTLRGSGVACDFDVATDLWSAEVDEGQVSQVINNIVLNAVQAQPDGGRIEVKAENVRLPDGSPTPIAAGDYVRVSWRDHGPGVPQEQLARVFDPYYTTKAGGSGLGLTTSHTIVTKHGGHLRAESRVGEGTTLHVYLPASRSAAPARRESTKRLRNGTGRVLVVDDDPSIRETARRLLGKLGYRCAAAADGREGARLYREAIENGERFDAVLMDLTLPGSAGGKEAMAEILRIDAKARGIVSSGYSSDDVLSNPSAHGFQSALLKPYGVEDLAQALHTLIGTRTD